MKLPETTKKAIVWLLILPIIWPQNLWALPEEISPENIPSVLSPQGETFEIPREMGTIVSSRVVQDQPRVFVIQDAHAVIDAQTNIEALINYLQKKYNVNLVALEGLTGDLDSTLYRAFPSENVKRKVFSEYLSRGELAGADLAAVSGPEEKIYTGIEDWAWYEKNYSAYLDASRDQEAFLAEIKKLRDRFDQKRQTVYSPELNELHEHVYAFQEKDAPLLDLLGFLKKYLSGAPEESSRYPELSKLFLSIQKNAALPAEELEKKIRVLADDFRDKHQSSLEKDPRMEFNARYQEFLTGKIEAASFLLFLMEFSQARGERLEIPEELQELLDYQETLLNIRGTALFKELEIWTEEIEARLTVNEEQRGLEKDYRSLRVLKNLAMLELDREEHSKLLSEKERYLAYLSSPALAAPALRFYEGAVRRDEILFLNMKRLLKERKQTAVIAVLGGFHTQGFQERLQAEGCSFAVLTPKMNSLKGHESYASLMRGKFSYREGLKDSFYDAFARHATMRLMSEFKETDGRTLVKNWRDNVIRTLARQGRVTAAADYTKYVDALLQPYIEEHGARGLFTGDQKAFLGKVKQRLREFGEKILSGRDRDFQGRLTELSGALAAPSSGTQTRSGLIQLSHVVLAPGFRSEVLERFVRTGKFELPAEIRVERTVEGQEASFLSSVQELLLREVREDFMSPSVREAVLGSLPEVRQFLEQADRRSLEKDLSNAAEFAEGLKRIIAGKFTQLSPEEITRASWAALLFAAQPEAAEKFFSTAEAQVGTVQPAVSGTVTAGTAELAQSPAGASSLGKVKDYSSFHYESQAPKENVLRLIDNMTAVLNSNYPPLKELLALSLVGLKAEGSFLEFLKGLEKGEGLSEVQQKGNRVELSFEKMIAVVGNQKKKGKKDLTGTSADVLALLELGTGYRVAENHGEHNRQDYSVDTKNFAVTFSRGLQLFASLNGQVPLDLFLSFPTYETIYELWGSIPSRKTKYEKSAEEEYGDVTDKVGSWSNGQVDTDDAAILEEFDRDGIPDLARLRQAVENETADRNEVFGRIARYFRYRYLQTKRALTDNVFPVEVKPAAEKTAPAPDVEFILGNEAALSINYTGFPQDVREKVGGAIKQALRESPGLPGWGTSIAALLFTENVEGLETAQRADGNASGKMHVPFRYEIRVPRAVYDRLLASGDISELKDLLKLVFLERNAALQGLLETYAAAWGRNSQERAGFAQVLREVLIAAYAAREGNALRFPGLSGELKADWNRPEQRADFIAQLFSLIREDLSRERPAYWAKLSLSLNELSGLEKDPALAAEAVGDVFAEMEIRAKVLEPRLVAERGYNSYSKTYSENYLIYRLEASGIQLSGLDQILDRGSRLENLEKLEQIAAFLRPGDGKEETKEQEARRRAAVTEVNRVLDEIFRSMKKEDRPAAVRFILKEMKDLVEQVPAEVRSAVLKDYLQAFSPVYLGSRAHPALEDFKVLAGEWRKTLAGYARENDYLYRPLRNYFEGYFKLSRKYFEEKEKSEYDHNHIRDYEKDSAAKNYLAGMRFLFWLARNKALSSFDSFHFSKTAMDVIGVLKFPARIDPSRPWVLKMEKPEDFEAAARFLAWFSGIATARTYDLVLEFPADLAPAWEKFLTARGLPELKKKQVLSGEQTLYVLAPGNRTLDEGLAVVPESAGDPARRNTASAALRADAPEVEREFWRNTFIVLGRAYADKRETSLEVEELVDLARMKGREESGKYFDLAVRKINEEKDQDRKKAGLFLLIDTMLDLGLAPEASSVLMRQIAEQGKIALDNAERIRLAFRFAEAGEDAALRHLTEDFIQLVDQEELANIYKNNTEKEMLRNNWYSVMVRILETLEKQEKYDLIAELSSVWLARLRAEAGGRVLEYLSGLSRRLTEQGKQKEAESLSGLFKADPAVLAEKIGVMLQLSNEKDYADTRSRLTSLLAPLRQLTSRKEMTARQTIAFLQFLLKTIDAQKKIQGSVKVYFKLAVLEEIESYARTFSPSDPGLREFADFWLSLRSQTEAEAKQEKIRNYRGDYVEIWSTHVGRIFWLDNFGRYWKFRETFLGEKDLISDSFWKFRTNYQDLEGRDSLIAESFENSRLFKRMTTDRRIGFLDTSALKKKAGLEDFIGSKTDQEMAAKFLAYLELSDGGPKYMSVIDEKTQEIFTSLEDTFSLSDWGSPKNVTPPTMYYKLLFKAVEFYLEKADAQHQARGKEIYERLQALLKRSNEDAAAALKAKETRPKQETEHWKNVRQITQRLLSHSAASFLLIRNALEPSRAFVLTNDGFADQVKALDKAGFPIDADDHIRLLERTHNEPSLLGTTRALVQNVLKGINFLDVDGFPHVLRRYYDLITLIDESELPSAEKEKAFSDIYSRVEKLSPEGVSVDVLDAAKSVFYFPLFEKVIVRGNAWDLKNQLLKKVIASQDVLTRLGAKSTDLIPMDLKNLVQVYLETVLRKFPEIAGPGNRATAEELLASELSTLAVLYPPSAASPTDWQTVTVKEAEKAAAFLRADFQREGTDREAIVAEIQIAVETLLARGGDGQFEAVTGSLVELLSQMVSRESEESYQERLRAIEERHPDDAELRLYATDALQKEKRRPPADSLSAREQKFLLGLLSRTGLSSALRERIIGIVFESGRRVPAYRWDLMAQPGLTVPELENIFDRLYAEYGKGEKNGVNDFLYSLFKRDIKGRSEALERSFFAYLVEVTRVTDAEVPDLVKAFAFRRTYEQAREKARARGISPGDREFIAFYEKEQADFLKAFRLYVEHYENHRKEKQKKKDPKLGPDDKLSDEDFFHVPDFDNPYSVRLAFAVRFKSPKENRKAIRDDIKKLMDLPSLEEEARYFPETFLYHPLYRDQNEWDAIWGWKKGEAARAEAKERGKQLFEGKIEQLKKDMSGIYEDLIRETNGVDLTTKYMRFFSPLNDYENGFSNVFYWTFMELPRQSQVAILDYLEEVAAAKKAGAGTREGSPSIEDVYLKLVKLAGAPYIKIGQILGDRADLVPNEEHRKKLNLLKSQNEALPIVQRMILDREIGMTFEEWAKKNSFLGLLSFSEAGERLPGIFDPVTGVYRLPSAPAKAASPRRGMPRFEDDEVSPRAAKAPQGDRPWDPNEFPFLAVIEKKTGRRHDYYAWVWDAKLGMPKQIMIDTASSAKADLFYYDASERWREDLARLGGVKDVLVSHFSEDPRTQPMPLQNIVQKQVWDLTTSFTEDLASQKKEAVFSEQEILNFFRGKELEILNYRNNGNFLPEELKDELNLKGEVYFYIKDFVVRYEERGKTYKVMKPDWENMTQDDYFKIFPPRDRSERQDLAKYPYVVFEAKPVGVASIGQVHRAIVWNAALKEGKGGFEIIYVKVVKPGVEDQIDKGRDLARDIAGRVQEVAARFPINDLERIVDQIFGLVEGETDLGEAGESGNLKRLKNLVDTLAKKKKEKGPKVSVVETYRDAPAAAAARKVRVMDLRAAHGGKGTELQALKNYLADLKAVERGRLSQADFDKKYSGTKKDFFESAKKQSAAIAEKYTGSLFDQIFTLDQATQKNRFHGDPHAGNVFVDRGGNIEFIDVGLEGQLDKKEMDQFQEVLLRIYLSMGNSFQDPADVDRLTDALLEIAGNQERFLKTSEIDAARDKRLGIDFNALQREEKLTANWFSYQAELKQKQAGLAPDSQEFQDIDYLIRRLGLERLRLNLYLMPTNRRYDASRISTLLSVLMEAGSRGGMSFKPNFVVLFKVLFTAEGTVKDISPDVDWGAMLLERVGSDLLKKATFSEKNKLIQSLRLQAPLPEKQARLLKAAARATPSWLEKTYLHTSAFFAGRRSRSDRGLPFQANGKGYAGLRYDKPSDGKAEFEKLFGPKGTLGDQAVRDELDKLLASPVRSQEDLGKLKALLRLVSPLGRYFVDQLEKEGIGILLLPQGSAAEQSYLRLVSDRRTEASKVVYIESGTKMEEALFHLIHEATHAIPLKPAGIPYPEIPKNVRNRAVLEGYLTARGYYEEALAVSSEVQLDEDLSKSLKGLFGFPDRAIEYSLKDRALKAREVLESEGFAGLAAGMRELYANGTDYFERRAKGVAGALLGEEHVDYDASGKLKEFEIQDRLHDSKKALARKYEGFINVLYPLQQTLLSALTAMAQTGKVTLEDATRAMLQSPELNKLIADFIKTFELGDVNALRDTDEMEEYGLYKTMLSSKAFLSHLAEQLGQQAGWKTKLALHLLTGDYKEGSHRWFLLPGVRQITTWFLRGQLTRLHGELSVKLQEWSRDPETFINSIPEDVKVQLVSFALTNLSNLAGSGLGFQPSENAAVDAQSLGAFSSELAKIFSAPLDAEALEAVTAKARDFLKASGMEPEVLLTGLRAAYAVSRDQMKTDIEKGNEGLLSVIEQMKTVEAAAEFLTREEELAKMLGEKFGPLYSGAERSELIAALRSLVIQESLETMKLGQTLVSAKIDEAKRAEFWKDMDAALGVMEKGSDKGRGIILSVELPKGESEAETLLKVLTRFGNLIEHLNLVYGAGLRINRNEWTAFAGKFTMHLLRPAREDKMMKELGQWDSAGKVNLLAFTPGFELLKKNPGLNALLAQIERVADPGLKEMALSGALLLVLRLARLTPSERQDLLKPEALDRFLEDEGLSFLRGRFSSTDGSFLQLQIETFVQAYAAEKIVETMA